MSVIWLLNKITSMATCLVDALRVQSLKYITHSAFSPCFFFLVSFYVVFCSSVCQSVSNISRERTRAWQNLGQAFLVL